MPIKIIPDADNTTLNGLQGLVVGENLDLQEIIKTSIDGGMVKL